MFKPVITAEVIRQVHVPDSKSTVEITYIKPGIMQTIESNSMNAASKQSGSGMKMEIGFNSNQKDRDIVQACVTGWSGFQNSKGNNIKFDNKQLVEMMKEKGFVEWVVEEHEKITVEVEGSEEEVAKNSKS